MLLIGFALMLRRFAALIHVCPGFVPENVVTANASMPKDLDPGMRSSTTGST
jgi:hypothetical protein